MGLLIDPISNSPNWHQNNYAEDREENYYWDLGSLRVNSCLQIKYQKFMWNKIIYTFTEKPNHFAIKLINYQ